MNHRLNAELRKLPPCPECDARRREPCTTEGKIKTTREPHRSREKVVSGELLVVAVSDARAARKLRAIRELVAAINGTV